MISALHHLFKRLMVASLALCIGFCLILTPFSGRAEAGSMSGNYQDDTLNVARSLQETISLENDAEGRSASAEEAVALITDYISRYRNRSQINKSVSFTTMQTALNAMAGHYKTYSNRPLPDQLKERLNKELSKAEELVVNEA